MHTINGYKNLNDFELFGMIPTSDIILVEYRKAANVAVLRPLGVTLTLATCVCWPLL